MQSGRAASYGVGVSRGTRCHLVRTFHGGHMRRGSINHNLLGGALRPTLAATLLIVLGAATVAQTPKPSPKPAPSPDVRLSDRGDRPAALAGQDAESSDKWATVFGMKIHYLDAGSG